MRPAALACPHGGYTLGVEEAAQVGADLRNEFLNVGVLGLRYVSNTVEKGHAG
jgi:hypothetical protein